MISGKDFTVPAQYDCCTPWYESHTAARAAASLALQVGNQRLSTGEYYDLIARLAGRQPPRRTVPVWLAAAWAAASAAFCAVAGGVPQVGDTCVHARGSHFFRPAPRYR